EDGPVSVSMHIRRGDYAKHPQLQVCTPAYYQAAFEFLKSKFEDFCVFVFSDDIPYCKEILAGNENVIYVENCGTDLDEFQLMSCCKHHVVANSTFSWWSAWLGEMRNQDGRMVLTPPVWYNEPEKYPQQMRHIDVTKIIPDHWTKIYF
ncbi:MAG: alpha-1,2-fucosyltransferase, partial [Chloroflexota bacterium]